MLPKMSVGRRIMRSVACLLPPTARWRVFQLQAGRRPLAEVPCEVLAEHADGRVEATMPENFDYQSSIAVFALSDGYATHHGATLTRDGYVVPELSREWNPQPVGHCKLLKPKFMPAVEFVKGPVASITLEHNSNYCHFLFEALPRLEILRRCGLGDVRIYANAAKAYQRDYFDLLGLKDARLINAGEHRLIQSDRLLVPTYGGYQGKFPQWVVDYLRAAFLPLVEREKPLQPGSRRIYITRKDADSRRILGEEDLIRDLERKNFEIVTLGGMPVREQIRLFAEASVLVAAHGASLTNMVYAGPQCRMLEIFPSNFFFDCYQKLSEKSGARPEHISCEPVQVGAGKLAQDLVLGESERRKILDFAG